MTRYNTRQITSLFCTRFSIFLWNPPSILNLVFLNQPTHFLKNVFFLCILFQIYLTCLNLMSFLSDQCQIFSFYPSTIITQIIFWQSSSLLHFHVPNSKCEIKSILRQTATAVLTKEKNMYKVLSPSRFTQNMPLGKFWEFAMCMLDTWTNWKFLQRGQFI